MQLGQKVISATIVLSCLTALGRALELLGVLIVARLISPDAFGIVAAALVVMQLTASLTELNISNALIQKSDLKEEDVHTSFTFSVVRGTLITLIMLALAYPVSNLLNQPRIALVIAALGVPHLVLSLASPNTVHYSRRVEPAKPAITVFLGRLIGFLATLSIALTTKSYWAIPIGLLVSNTIIVITSYLIAPYEPKLSLKSARWLFSYAGWMNLLSMTIAGRGQADRFYIGSSLGATVLGVYTLATSIASQLLWATAAPIMNALFAGLSSVQKDTIRLRRGFIRAQQLLVALMMPVGIGLALVAEPLVLVILGPEWQMAARIIAIIAPVTALEMMSVGAQALGLALGQPKQLFLRSLISFVALLPCLVIGVWGLGITGAAWARAFSIFVMIYLYLSLVHRLIDLSVWAQIKSCYRSLLSSAAMVLTVYPLGVYLNSVMPQMNSLLTLTLMVTAGSFTYIFAHLVLWFLSSKPEGPEALIYDLTQKIWNSRKKSNKAL